MPDYKERSWFRPDFLASLGVAAVVSVATVLVAVLDRTGSKIPLVSVGIGILVALYAVLTVQFITYFSRTRHYAVRIALTGKSRAGKTVLANILYDQLMNLESASGGFTAESKSAIAVYQAIRGMANDKWPPSTVEGSVIPYRGTLELGRRVRIDLEIGDSAGQHWMDLTNQDAKSADYLEYVISADALVHVISVEELVSKTGSSSILQDLDELHLAAQLMRSAKKTRGDLGPLLIAISKVDLACDMQTSADELLRIMTSGEFESSSIARCLRSTGGGDAVNQVPRIVDRLSSDFTAVNIMASSIVSATGPTRLLNPVGPDLVRWIEELATSGSRGDPRSLVRR